MSVTPAGGVDHGSPGLWSRADFILAATVAAVAAAIAVLYLSAFFAAGSKASFYQGDFGPAVLWTCGHGFRLLPKAAPGSDALYEFLRQERLALDCSELPAALATAEPPLFAFTHRYLLLLAGGIWKVTGISWSPLRWVGSGFAAVAAACCYLFFRCALGRIFAILLTAIWLLSPLHLAQLPHLRDYAKAPFFMLTLCSVAWIVLSRPSRRTTVAAAAATGAALGVGFGMRTDVLAYLIIVLVALLFFRPGLDRLDFGIRLTAAGAALLGFVVASWPILLGYRGGDNVAHVAVLGLTDSSRDALALRGGPYSYGYMYHDLYVEAVIGGHIEREIDLAAPLTIGTPEYARWGNIYYRELVSTFSADTLVRAWAAVIGVFDSPLRSYNAFRPPWFVSVPDSLFMIRARILEWLSIVPPSVIAAIVIAGISGYSLRLAAVALFFATIVPGLTAVQFHSRHFFHLEPLPLFAYGLALTIGWRLLRRRMPVPQDGLRPAFLRIAALTAVVALGIVAPVTAARRVQQDRLQQLFGSYLAAPSTDVKATPAAAESGAVLFPVTIPPANSPGRFVDANLLKVVVGGPDCDAESVPLTFRYEADPPLADFSRSMSPIAPATGPRTFVVFPVYTPGAKSQVSDAMKFVGVEVPAEHQSCIEAIGRFAHPDAFPMLVEATLAPGWRSRRLFETLRYFEPSLGEDRPDEYFAPEAVHPGRRWLAQIESLTAEPAHRSAVVKELVAGGIHIDGTPPTTDEYLLIWPELARASGATLLVTGELLEGGVTIGLQQKQHWKQTVTIQKPGEFRAFVRVDDEGPYNVVIAGHLMRKGRISMRVNQYGWLPPRS